MSSNVAETSSSTAEMSGAAATQLRPAGNKRLICPCCMEAHAPKLLQIHEYNVYKGIEVWYDAEYFYCEKSDETYEEEQQMSSNHAAMLEAYERSRRG